MSFAWRNVELIVISNDISIDGYILLHEIGVCFSIQCTNLKQETSDRNELSKFVTDKKYFLLTEWI